MRSGIGIELKLRRIRAGVRQYQVARELGIPPSMLCDWENGRKPVPPRRVAEITAAIDRLGGACAGEAGDASPV